MGAAHHTAAGQQWAMDMWWLHFLEKTRCPLFLQSMVYLHSYTVRVHITTQIRTTGSMDLMATLAPIGLKKTNYGTNYMNSFFGYI